MCLIICGKIYNFQSFQKITAMKNLSKEELIQKLGDIEWEDFEVKEAKSDVPKSSWETVSSFSNTSGGRLVFGVKKEGKKYDINGVENPEKIEQDFISVLRSGLKFNKKLEVKCQKYNFGEKIVLAFYISASENKPVFYDSHKNTFIRTGSGDQRATQEELNAILRDSAFGTKDKEVTKFKLKDLDKETLTRFKNYIKNLDSANQYSNLSDSELFEKLRVTIDGKVTVAGLLMFGNGESINGIFSDFMIDYMEIRGTSYSDAPERYTYRMPVQKNIYNYFFIIFERLLTKIDIPFKTKGVFRDENQPQVLAIREALVNLLAHSDYFSTMKPRIRVFSDRIEFMNPGSLPAPVEVLRKQELTLPRNPILIKIFRVLKIAENAGYGFDKMFNGWKSHYNLEPIVENGIIFYKIEFPLKTKLKNVPEKDLEKDLEKLNQNQRKILQEIMKNKNITQKELSQTVGISEKNIRNNIAKLKEIGIIGRIGPDKGGHWEIIKNEN